MSKFVVSKWFENRAKLNIQNFEVENIEFELMALTDELIERVKAQTSYDDMISFAADAGISYNRKRVFDDSELSKDFDILWGIGEMEVDCDPCIKYRVGEKVCEISGITDVIEEMLELEREAELDKNISIDGDNLPDGDVTLQQLNDDANSYAAAS